MHYQARLYGSRIAKPAALWRLPMTAAHSEAAHIINVWTHDSDNVVLQCQ